MRSMSMKIPTLCSSLRMTELVQPLGVLTELTIQEDSMVTMLPKPVTRTRELELMFMFWTRAFTLGTRTSKAVHSLRLQCIQSERYATQQMPPVEQTGRAMEHIVPGQLAALSMVLRRNPNFTG